MKKLHTVLLVLFFVAPAFAQERSMVPASQDDVNNGANASKAVTPATLLQRPGGIGIYGFGSPNLKSNQTQFTAWLLTNNVFATVWPSTGTNTWKFAEIGFTNSNLYHNGGGFGFAINPIVMLPRSNARFLTSFTFPTAGIANEAGFYVGFMTNASGVLPADDSPMFGFGVNNNPPTFGQYRAAAMSLSAGYGNTVTNGTYNICISSDQSNLCWVAIYPGHTNEVRAVYPWSAVANQIGVSNFSIATYATNVLWNAVGGRAASQSIYPRTGGEGVSDFVVYSNNTNGNVIRVVLPAGFDTGTNVPNLMIFCHGNTGSEVGCFDQLDAEGGLEYRNYFNALVTNNFILASYGDNNTGNNHRTDTWGTTNALNCVDATIAYVKQRWPYKNIFLWGESAGGATALGYAARYNTNKVGEKIAGILLNHAVYSISNQYAVTKSDIDIAFGGTTAAEFANSDPGGFPASAFSGIPISATASSGDTIVVKALQTDLLIQALGGVINGSATNTPFSPEVNDLTRAGAVGVHGGLCVTPTVAARDFPFLKRCAAYANFDASAVVNDQKVFGSLSVGSSFNLSTNATIPSPTPGVVTWWFSNYDGWIVTPFKTNRVFQGQ